MEFEVKESIALEDGKHEGVISKIEYRTEPYEYTDIFIKDSVTGYELKYGCPSVISAKSKLGKLIRQFQEIEKGQKINPEKVLLEKEVFFMTMQEQKGDNTYTRVVDGSVKKKESV